MRAPALSCFALVVTLTAARAAAALPFIEDDFEQARQQATARRLPLFVEAWAPW